MASVVFAVVTATVFSSSFSWRSAAYRAWTWAASAVFTGAKVPSGYNSASGGIDPGDGFGGADGTGLGELAEFGAGVGEAEALGFEVVGCPALEVPGVGVWAGGEPDGDDGGPAVSDGSGEGDTDVGSDDGSDDGSEVGSEEGSDGEAEDGSGDGSADGVGGDSDVVVAEGDDDSVCA